MQVQTLLMLLILDIPVVLEKTIVHLNKYALTQAFVLLAMILMIKITRNEERQKEFIIHSLMQFMHKIIVTELDNS